MSLEKESETTSFRSEIEVEIIRRIKSLHEIALIGSNMSKAKHKARAAELSDLLGWIRNCL